MQRKSLLKLSLGIALAFFSGKLNAQATIAGWNYDAITGQPTSPIADVGTGSSSIIGSLAIANAATGMHPTTNNGCGAQNGNNPGAWAFTANPGATNESSGVQYSASTVGYQGIKFTWDQRCQIQRQIHYVFNIRRMELAGKISQ